MPQTSSKSLWIETVSPGGVYSYKRGSIRKLIYKLQQDHWKGKGWGQLSPLGSDMTQHTIGA